MLDLFDEIIAKQRRPGDARRVGAGLVEPRKGPRKDRPRELVGIFYAQLRVSEAAVGARACVGRGAVADIIGKSAAQVPDRFLVNRGELIHDIVRAASVTRHARPSRQTSTAPPASAHPCASPTGIITFQ